MDNDTRSSRLTHLPALDGARGLAVSAVLFFHGGHLLGGYLGVDFFFTLSGFLITSLLLAEVARTGSVALGSFWARRARRLLPALALLMVGVVIYCLALAKPDEAAQIRGDGLATIFYAANWRRVYATQSYWALFTAPSPLNHTWSLAIEEQFYGFWPLIVVGLLASWRRAVARAVLVTAVALAAVSTMLMFSLYDATNTNRDYFGTDTRAAAILLGAALAAVLALRGPAQRARSRAMVETVGIAGAVVLGFAVTHLDGQSERLYRGGFLLCGLAAIAVIGAAVQPAGGIVSRALSFTPFRLLGLISYGVYLYHWPIDVLLDAQRVGYTGWPLFALQTAATLTVAIASYRFIEQPIRRGALTTMQLRRLTPAVAVLATIALLAATAGGKSRAPVVTFGNPVAIATQARRNAPTNAERIMVVGDSVANFLALSMSRPHETPPVVTFDATQPGCIFPDDITRVEYGQGKARAATSCDAVWEAKAMVRFKPDIVLWIVSNPAKRLLYRGHWIRACTPEHDGLYEHRLRQEITGRLAATGARVVLTTTAYVPNGGGYDGDPLTDCDNRLRRRVAMETHTQLVDLFAHVCPGGRCRERIDGVTLRPDGLHYEGEGATLVANWILGRIRSGP